MFEYIVLGFVEGVTEFLPISSSAHLLLVRYLWFPALPAGLAVDAVLQLGSVCAVVLYFAQDLIKIASAPRTHARLLAWLVIATVPAVVVGYMFESAIENSLRSPYVVIFALITGSIIFFAAERALVRNERAPLESLTFKGAALIGCMQVLAFVPGMSRSGMTASAGIFARLSREDAYRFSFLLSIPILLGTGLKKFIDLYQTGFDGIQTGFLLAGFVTSFLVSIVSIYILMKTVTRVPLTWFALYRVILAAVLTAALIVLPG